MVQQQQSGRDADLDAEFVAKEDYKQLEGKWKKASTEATNLRRELKTVKEALLKATADLESALSDATKAEDNFIKETGRLQATVAKLKKQLELAFDDVKFSPDR